MWSIISIMSFMEILFFIWRAFKKCQCCGPNPTPVKTDSPREGPVPIHFEAFQEIPMCSQG